MDNDSDNIQTMGLPSLRAFLTNAEALLSIYKENVEYYQVARDNQIPLVQAVKERIAELEKD